MNRTTGDFAVYAEKEVVEEVEDSIMEISLADARMISPKYVIGDTVQVPLDSQEVWPYCQAQGMPKEL